MRRRHVRIDDARWTRLEAAASRRGSSVAAVVRDAIDAALDGEGIVRKAAADTLLAAPPMAVDDWEVMKATLGDP